MLEILPGAKKGDGNKVSRMAGHSQKEVKEELKEEGEEVKEEGEEGKEEVKEVEEKEEDYTTVPLR